ncbi:hypothetical protein ACEWAY_23260, partial [Vibrio parahaemolyticus]
AGASRRGRSDREGGGDAAERDERRGRDWGELVPRLQRFYGGRPDWWLAEAPAALVRAFIVMLPRIEAMEQLSAIEAASMAMGSADDP